MADIKNVFEWHQSERINGWYIMSARSKVTKEWTAWAKSTPMVAMSPLTEPGDDVYFEFGSTREEAILKLVNNDLSAVA